MKGWKSTGRIERGKYKTGSSSKRGERSDKNFSRYFKTVSRKKIGAFAAVLLAISVPAEPVWASDLIGTVKVEFSEAGNTYENGLPEIEGETNSNKYSLSEVTTLEEYMSQWEDIDEEEDEEENDRKDNSDLLAYNETYQVLQDYSQVVYAVIIDAEEEYYFSSSLDRIQVSGLGAECVRAERINDKHTLVLFVRFEELDYLPGELSETGWQEPGRALWNCSGNPKAYHLRLYLDGKPVGGIKETGGPSYDFQPLMQKAGEYHYQIRTVSVDGTKGDWVESERISISDELARQYQTAYEVIPILAEETEQTGPAQIVGYENTGWQDGGDGRFWYRETDGSYPQNSWSSIDGAWYFFDRAGYMCVNAYISWGDQTFYVAEDGRMLVEGKAPDGRNVQADGSLAWPES